MKRSPKLIVIGWDAATWKVLLPWVEKGYLPHLAEMMDQGVFGTLHSTPLPVSPAAWTTIVTGKNPAKHNVFDWFSRDEGSYQVTYVHSGQIRTRTVWDYLNQAGLRVGVFNLPMLYPASTVDGFMLSGLAAPSAHADGFSYPTNLIQEIEMVTGPYWTTEPEIYQYGREQEYLDNILAWLEYQKQVLDYLFENHPSDVYWLVFMQTDHILHKFWRYMDDTFPGYRPAYDSQYKDAILKVFQRLDAILGEWKTTLGDDTNFMLISDHGAGPVQGVMFINRWLNDRGYLFLKRTIATQAKYWLAKTNLISRLYRVVSRFGLGGLANLVSKPTRNKVVSSFLGFDDIDWSKTRAYARGAFGQIFVNLKEREPQGIVAPGEEYEQLLTDLIHELAHLAHPETGEPLITKIHRREEVYQGPYLENAADLMFSIQDYLYQSSVKMGLENESILGLSEYGDSGSHRPDGIFVFSGNAFQKQGLIPAAQAADILPTILALCDIPIPTDMDGSPISNAITPEIRDQVHWISPDDQVEQESRKPDLNQEEMDKLENRLRDLGYLG